MPKRYTVTGSQPVLDHQPGESFDADLDPHIEAFLISIGALKLNLEPFAKGGKVEDEIKRLNVKSYNVNGPREERPR